MPLYVPATSGGQLIESKTFNGSEATYTLSGFSALFRAIRIIGYLRSDRAAQARSNGTIRFNGDTGANYNLERGVADGATAAGTNSLAATGMNFDLPGATAPAGEAASFDALIYFPQSAFQKKATFTLGQRVGTLATDHELYTNVGYWLNTAAITSISITEINSANFTSGSTLDFYGIR